VSLLHRPVGDRIAPVALAGRATDGADPLGGTSRLAVLAMIAGIILLGIYPQPVLSALIR